MEESPVAGVRRVRTSPGFFMRKRKIVRRRQRSAGRHHAAERENPLCVSLQPSTQILRFQERILFLYTEPKGGMNIVLC